MSIAIQDLEVKKEYVLGRIIYLESMVTGYQNNSKGLSEDICKRQISISEQSIAKYRTKIHNIDGALAALKH
jgi:hypothetical protein